MKWNKEKRNRKKKKNKKQICAREKNSMMMYHHSKGNSNEFTATRRCAYVTRNRYRKQSKEHINIERLSNDNNYFTTLGCYSNKFSKKTNDEVTDMINIKNTSLMNNTEKNEMLINKTKDTTTSAITFDTYIRSTRFPMNKRYWDYTESNEHKENVVDYNRFPKTHRKNNVDNDIVPIIKKKKKLVIIQETIKRKNKLTENCKGKWRQKGAKK